MKICKTCSFSSCLSCSKLFLGLILVLLIKSIYSVQYNQPCTFSSGTCNWSIGRRWHIINSDNDDKSIEKKKKFCFFLVNLF